MLDTTQRAGKFRRLDNVDVQASGRSRLKEADFEGGVGRTGVSDR